MEHTSSELIDYTEWEPYHAAALCLERFASRFPEVVVPAIVEYVNITKSSESPRIREAALACLKAGNCFDESFIEFISESLVDDDTRLSRSALLCLNQFLRTPGRSSVPFSGLIPIFFELAKAEFPISRQAVRAVKLISRMEDFDQFHIIFPNLFALFPILSPETFSDLFACFTPPSTALLNPDTAFSAFDFLFHQLDGEHPIAPICRSLSSLAFRFDSHEISPAVYESMLTHYHNTGITECFLVIASLHPVFLQSILCSFLPVVLEGESQYGNPEIVQPAVESIGLLIERVSLDQCISEVISSLTDCLQMGTGAAVKGEVITTFTKMFAKKSDTTATVISIVLPVTVLIMSNIEKLEELYGCQSKFLIKPICRFLSATLRLKKLSAECFGIVRSVVDTLMNIRWLLELAQVEFAEAFVLLVRKYQRIGQVGEGTALLQRGMQKSPYVREMIEAAMRRIL
jgi:hypothetical protein